MNTTAPQTTRTTLTREQLEATIERANMSPKMKAILRGQIKTSPEARFTVYGMWLRQGCPV